MDTTTRTHTDGALLDRIEEEKKKLSTGWILAGIGAVLAVIGLFGFMGGDLFTFLLLILGVILAGIGLARNKKIHDSIKKLLSDHLMPSVLREIFESASHDPFGRLPDSTVYGIDLDFPTFNEVSGSDYIRGIYKGLEVEMSDLQLVHHERRRVYVNGKWRTQETRTTVFKGQWMVCDFGKELAADLLLREKGLLDLSRSTVETESEAFNKRFCIQSQDGHSVFYILTPHMMEYILTMDDKGGGTTRMRFTREGKVHIAIHNNRDALQIKSGDYADLGKIREQFRSDIRYLTDLIDELRLVDTICKKS